MYSQTKVQLCSTSTTALYYYDLMKREMAAHQNVIHVEIYWTVSLQTVMNQNTWRKNAKRVSQVRYCQDFTLHVFIWWWSELCCVCKPIVISQPLNLHTKRLKKYSNYFSHIMTVTPATNCIQQFWQLGNNLS